MSCTVYCPVPRFSQISLEGTIIIKILSYVPSPAGVVRVSMKVIVVHGELRKTIQDVSRLP
jgi:hypothetical protein